MPAIYGEQWRAAIPLVEILSLVALLRSSGSPVGALLLGLGKASWGFWWSVGKTLLQVPVLYFGILADATHGAALAYLALQVLFTVASYPLLIGRLLGPGAAEYVRNFLPSLAVAITVAVAVRAAMPLVDSFPPLTQLLVLLPVAGLAYGAFAALFARRTVMEVVPMLWSRK